MALRVAGPSLSPSDTADSPELTPAFMKWIQVDTCSCVNGNKDGDAYTKVVCGQTRPCDLTTIAAASACFYQPTASCCTVLCANATITSSHSPTPSSLSTLTVRSCLDSLDDWWHNLLQGVGHNLRGGAASSKPGTQLQLAGSSTAPVCCEGRRGKGVCVKATVACQMGCTTGDTTWCCCCQFGQSKPHAAMRKPRC